MSNRGRPRDFPDIVWSGGDADAAPDQVFAAIDMIGDGGRIAVTWSWRGTRSAEIAGIPATGRPITMTGVTVYHFDGDRIAGHWQIADKLAVVMQLRGT